MYIYTYTHIYRESLIYICIHIQLRKDIIAYLPVIFAKKPYILAKEPCISSQETYIYVQVGEELVADSPVILDKLLQLVAADASGNGWFRALLLTFRDCCRDIGFFCGDIGLFCGDVGLFCGDIRLFCGDLRLFCGDVRLFCGHVGLFGAYIGLCCGDVGLFCGYTLLQLVAADASGNG